MSEKDFYFQAAIDVIINPATDQTRLIAELAKRYPEILCELAGVGPWQIVARGILASEGKIPAVKYVRGQTGMSLAEAVKAVDAL
jgi:ribosomal protein L7/L12